MVCIIGHLCAGHDGALGAARVGAGATTEGLVRGGNCLTSSRSVEIPDVAREVFIDPKEVVCLYISHKVCAEN